MKLHHLFDLDFVGYHTGINNSLPVRSQRHSTTYFAPGLLNIDGIFMVYAYFRIQSQIRWNISNRNHFRPCQPRIQLHMLRLFARFLSQRIRESGNGTHHKHSSWREDLHSRTVLITGKSVSRHLAHALVPTGLRLDELITESQLPVSTELYFRFWDHFTSPDSTYFLPLVKTIACRQALKLNMREYLLLYAFPSQFVLTTILISQFHFDFSSIPLFCYYISSFPRPMKLLDTIFKVHVVLKFLPRRHITSRYGPP